MFRGLFVLIIFFSAVLCLKTSGYGDVVRLKNGIVLTGDIIMETETEVVIKMAKYGEGRIKKFAINSIEYTAVPEVNYSVVSNGVTQEPKKEQNYNTNGVEKPKESQKKYEDYFHMLLGANVGSSALWQGLSFENTQNILGVDVPFKISMDDGVNFFMNTGIFVDLQFLRLDLSYVFILNAYGTQSIRSAPSPPIPMPFLIAQTNTLTNKLSISYLNISLLLKIPPSPSGAISFWPAVGVEYDIALTYLVNDVNVLTNKDSDLNDFWILAGGGMNIRLADHFYLIPSVIFGYNLTAAPIKDTDTDMLSLSKSFADVKLFTYGFKVNINLGFAYEL